ncbi:MAG: diaminopimelate epimerase [Lachnospiraceae bacterium]|jgi:diaminopimelate epimerase|nr:diaminopimelate epimerase [Lachnospiraceae bacterium]MEE3460503.1 diaminopimelate epimerase [Lachnospiraceae bacterium]
MVNFTKMHGCGNDYVYVNMFEEKISDPAKFAVKISDRHFGIGSDGLILIAPSDKADFRMIMYNADGSEGQMCGNGIRCVAKYVYDRGMTDSDTISIETGAGIKTLKLFTSDGKVDRVTVDMGAPILTPKDIPVMHDGDRMVGVPVQVLGSEYKITAVSMGNPHSVIFTDEASALPDRVKDIKLIEIGPAFENLPIFPERVNTEFVEVLNEREVNMRVWERGSGETLACGTGTCAVLAACILNKRTGDDINVNLLGGKLNVRFDRETGHIFMTGPAQTVFSGSVEE